MAHFAVRFFSNIAKNTIQQVILPCKARSVELKNEPYSNHLWLRQSNLFLKNSIISHSSTYPPSKILTFPCKLAPGRIPVAEYTNLPVDVADCDPIPPRNEEVV